MLVYRISRKSNKGLDTTALCSSKELNRDCCTAVLLASDFVFNSKLFNCTKDDFNALSMLEYSK